VDNDDDSWYRILQSRKIKPGPVSPISAASLTETASRLCVENILAQGTCISPLLGACSTMRGNLYSKVRTDTTWSMQILKSRHVCRRCRERLAALYLDSGFFTGSRQDASKSVVSATCSRCSDSGKIRSIDILANELISGIINGRVCDGAQVSNLLDCPGKMVDRSPTPP
jgi:hypothetical protein